MDTSTGLIYVGNGQYYDPTTGRFLSRGVNSNSTNPYVPWGGNPTGALFTPLALLSLVYSRKKKRGTLDTIIILIVLGVSLGMGLSACGTNPAPPPPTVTATIAMQATPNPAIETATVTPSIPVPSYPPVPIVATPCATVTITYTLGTPTPGTLIGEFAMSAYYFPIEDQYTVGADVAIPADKEAKVNSGYPPDAYVYLSSAGPYHYNNLGPDHYEYANWSFLNDPKGVCYQGTGKLNSRHGGYYIGCTTPPGTTPAFEWQTQQKLNSVAKFQTVAVSPSHAGGLLPLGTRIEITDPDLVSYLRKHGNKNATLTVTDIGEALDDKTLDLFVGEGPDGLSAYYELLNIPTHTAVSIYNSP